MDDNIHESEAQQIRWTAPKIFIFKILPPPQKKKKKKSQGPLNKRN